VRILHLSKFYPPDPGGLEQVVAQLAEGTVRAGHEVRVVAATGSAWARSPGRRLTEPPHGGVVVVRLPTPRIVWSQPLARGYFAAARGPADVVHLHHPHPLADMAFLAGPRRPLVVTHHSDIRRQVAARPLYLPLIRSVLKRASAIVAATGAHIAISRELQGFEGKTRVIPFGVDVQRFVPKPDVKRPACFPGDGATPVGLFVGRLLGYKGLHVLLDAVKGTDLHVVIVGGGPIRAELEQRIERLGLKAQIVLAGEVSDDELPCYYRAASYFVLPSVTPQEMFGVTLLEAMASERPIVSTALPTGVHEVNVANVTGLEVPVGDATELRKAMRRLAEDPALRAKLGAAGRQRVLERFTLERMIHAHLGLYEELAG
jgi:glycosyltransferase involved in cell wall biosynthesis